jgi:uroporphyrinogen decarboxylase
MVSGGLIFLLSAFAKTRIVGGTMNSKELVYAALRGQRTERIPVYMWYGERATQRLAAHLQIRPEEIEDRLGNDIRQDWLTINKQMSVPCAEGGSFVDEWGITWSRSGAYNTPVRHPFADLDAAQIAAAPFPDVDAPSRYAGFNSLLATKPTHFIGADVSGSLFEPAYHLRGMENLLVDLASEAEEAEVLLNRLEQFTTAVALNALRAGADWIWLGDDFGTQVSMIVSPATWRKHFKPRMARIISALRAARREAVIAYHSCGSIRPIIGELVEIGINVLNPIQESAVGMDQGEIRRSFPTLTLFCGLDTQQYLVSAKPDAVYRDAVAKIKQLGANGHYLFGCSHTIQGDVPPENILAMIRAAQDVKL